MIKIVCNFLFILLLVPFSPAAEQVKNYRTEFSACSLSSDTTLYIGLRSFTMDSISKMLIVDPNDMKTRIVFRSVVAGKDYPLSYLHTARKTSAYMQALDSALKNRLSLQDAGLRHGYSMQKGIELTADLCPSGKHLDRSLFKKLIETFGERQKPIPIALAVTGKWMENHEGDLQWLMDLEKKGYFSITWINHSYNHRMAKDIPLKQNFILEKGTDIESEVLRTEKKMIEHGITPSVFFRFPGLVSDSMVFSKIIGYGLIPIGTDAWLAKKEKPSNGSIVLVHANGNEPYGINQFFKLVNDKKDSIHAGTWLLYDLRKSIIEEQSGR